MNTLLAWVKTHRVVAIGGSLLVVLAVWTVLSMNQDDQREADGYNVCEAAIKDQLIGDYDPVITVTFKESMPAGDLSYTAYSDDGDGQWSCTVSGSGAGMEATVFDGN